jgi:hypothetical protein
MASPSTQKYVVDRLAASGAVLATPLTIMAVLIVGITNDCLVEYTNDADGSATNLLSVGAAAETGSMFVDLSELGGVRFDTKCYAAITGTCEVYTWYS